MRPRRQDQFHCHAADSALDRAGFEALATESDRPPPAGCSALDSQLGFALRRWCAPVLGLPPHADGDAYLARRREVGAVEVNRRLLRAAEVDVYLVDTGFHGGELLGPAEIARAAGAAAREIVRLETVAEELGEVTAEGFAEAYGDALARATAQAVAVKSIVAYRHGLDFDPQPPARREVIEAAGRWLRDGRPRIADPVLLRHLLWAGISRGLPVQLQAWSSPWPTTRSATVTRSTPNRTNAPRSNGFRLTYCRRTPIPTPSRACGRFAIVSHSY
jgi:hypothetical protein